LNPVERFVADDADKLAAYALPLCNLFECLAVAIVAVQNAPLPETQFRCRLSDGYSIDQPGFIVPVNQRTICLSASWQALVNSFSMRLALPLSLYAAIASSRPSAGSRAFSGSAG
jgi:hypothetical protein